MIDICIVFGYLLVALIVGVWVGKRVECTSEFKGGRQYSAWVIFICLSASFIGGGFTLGLAEKVFIFGIVYIIAICGFSLKELMIGLIIVPRMQNFRNVSTVGDIMEIAYGRKAKIITGIASILICGGIIGAQISACGSILHTFFGPPPAIGTLLAGGIVIIYATLGGLRSVIAVDILHFFVFALILPLVLFFGLKEVGGINAFIQNIPASHLELPGLIDMKTFVVLFLSFFLGESLIPPYIQRLVIGKSMNATKKGTILSGVFSIFFFLAIGLIGIVAVILTPGLSPASALPNMIQMVMPIGLKGLAIAAMLAVIMSSVDSFLNSIAISFSQDILQPLKIVAKNKNQELIVYRSITLFIGAVAIIISLSLSTSIDILLYSYQFWTPIILVPFIAAIFGLRSSWKTFVIATLTGFLAVIGWHFYTDFSWHLDGKGTLEASIIGVFANLLAFLISYQLETKQKELDLETS